MKNEKKRIIFPALFAASTVMIAIGAENTADFFRRFLIFASEWGIIWLFVIFNRYDNRKKIKTDIDKDLQEIIDQYVTKPKKSAEEKKKEKIQRIIIGIILNAILIAVFTVVGYRENGSWKNGLELTATVYFSAAALIGFALFLDRIMPKNKKNSFPFFTTDPDSLNALSEEACKSLEQYKNQLDGLLKAGIIDLDEYKKRYLNYRDNLK